MSVDVAELVAFRNKLEKLQQDKDVVINALAKELASRLLRKVKKRTPVGKKQTTTVLRWRRNKDGSASVMKNKDGSSKTKEITTYTGGTLKKGWVVGNTYSGCDYIAIIIKNDVFYASYVENGHRQQPGRYVPAIGCRLKKGWVRGRKMLALSVEELQKDSQAVIEKRIQKWLESVIR